jgi:hypothetical protein
MRRIIFSLVALIALLGVALAVTPLDLIRPGAERKLVALSGTDPSSAKEIAALNEPLGPYEEWNLPNIGHYASWAVYDVQGINNSSINQDDLMVRVGLEAFANSIPPLPASVGDPNAPTTDVSGATTINGVMVWE